MLVEAGGRAEGSRGPSTAPPTLAAPPSAPASDASKVVAKGLGLSKAFVGQKNSFTVDCSKAGECREFLWGWGAGSRHLG